MSDDAPPDESDASPGESDAPPDESGTPPDDFDPRAWLAWFRRTDRPAVEFVREMLSTALLVAVVGLVLFGASGIWPPMVAVESPSMEPHMERGDLVFVMEEHRLAPAFATDAPGEAGEASETGVVTYRVGEREGFRKSGGYGDVIVYRPDGSRVETPIIHRAHFWVNESENWYDKANPEYVAGDSCAAISNCPAPHSGFVTKGDNNRYYDQVTGLSDPVRPSWIRGTAEVRIPFLGHLRLALS